MVKAQTTAPDFEATLKRLEQLLAQMEGGNLPLENAIKLFEEGVGLVRQCQTVLQTAEQRVAKLMEKNGAPSLENFSPENT